MSTTTVDATYELIERSRLHESPLNPRHTYDPAKLAELAASIKAKGIISPLLIRPNAKGYEIAAGHRRYRAAAIADLGILPCIVRPMDDAEFVEVLNIENLQREDLTPLEEAEGYKLLMTKASYSVERIAERVGKSEKYVYDRVKLLQLIPEAKKLLNDGTITAGHAIILARLAAKDQARAIEIPENSYRAEGGLLTYESVLEDPEGEEPIAEPVKARSVRELQGWVDEHVRFAVDPKTVDPMVFPETAKALVDLKPKEKVIHITHDHHVPEDARDGSQRTFGPQSWVEASGERKSKTCEYSVLGVIVVGPGRGESFRVCTQKEKCKIHWSKWQKERAQRAKTRAGGGEAGAADRRELARAQRETAERAAQDAKRLRFEKGRPAVLEAIAAAVKKASASSTGVLADLLVGAGRRRGGESRVPRGKTAEDLVRFLAMQELEDAAHQWRAESDFPKVAKALGVDVAKVLDKAVPIEKKKATEK